MTARNVEFHIGVNGLGTIELDGEKLTGVRGFIISSEAGKRPTVTLDFVVLDTDYFGEADVFVHEKAHASLVKLGWTPPADDDASSTTDL
jgi:hypothetical protein